MTVPPYAGRHPSDLAIESGFVTGIVQRAYQFCLPHSMDGEVKEALAHAVAAVAPAADTSHPRCIADLGIAQEMRLA